MRTYIAGLVLAVWMAFSAGAQAPCVGATEADNEFYRITASDMEVTEADVKLVQQHKGEALP